MTNKEWLDYLAHNAPDELAAWFDAEHVETKEMALDGDTAALNATIAELERKLRISWEYECKFQDERDELQAQVDELTAERDKLKELNGYHAAQYELASEDCDRLQAEVDTLKSRHCPHYDATEHTCDVHETRIAELTAEREQYRKLFGMALDWAHEITMLETSIDEGMA